MLIQAVHTVAKWFQRAEWLYKVQHKITTRTPKGPYDHIKFHEIALKNSPRCFRRINFNWWNGWPFWPWHRSWTASALWDWESWTWAEGGKRRLAVACEETWHLFWFSNYLLSTHGGYDPLQMRRCDHQGGDVLAEARRWAQSSQVSFRFRAQVLHGKPCWDQGSETTDMKGVNFVDVM